MKKGIVLGLASLFVLTGCGKKVVCSATEGEGDKKYTYSYTATIKDDKVSALTITAEFQNKKTAEEACKEAKDGATKDAKVKCSGKKVSITGPLTDEEKKTTKDEFVKSMETIGFKCEK